MRTNSAAAACGALVLVLLALPARAGTAVRLGLADLAQRADLAIEGRILSTTARAGAGGRIETEILVRVERTFVGAPCGLQTVRLPGGVLPDGRGLCLPGMPALSAGEDVVLFLSAEGPRGTRMPVGLAQGRLRVVVQADGSRRLVGDAAGLALVGPVGTAVPPGAGIDYVAGLAEIEAGLAARRAEGR
jgi:hypothetical protein